MKFLGRAKKFLQDLGTEAPSKTQTFNLACASGHRVRGERTEGYQALRCPSCGEGVFVLPRSPLPEPVAHAKASGSRGRYGRPGSPWADEGPVELHDGGAAGEGAEIIWDDESAEATPRTSPRPRPGSRRRTSPPPRSRRPGRTQSAADREQAPSRRRPGSPRTVRECRGRDPGGPPPIPQRARTPVAGPAPVVIEARPRARRGPRLGLIFFLLALLIVATVGWRVWKNRRRSIR